MNWPRRRFRATAVALISCAALSISGCAQADPPAPPATTESTPSTAGAPVLTDAEALKIAVDAYQAYFAATSEVMTSGTDPNGILLDTSTSKLADENKGILDDAQQHNYEISGVVGIKNTQIKSISVESGATTIEAYACLDATGVTTLRDGQPTSTSQGESVSKSSVVIKVDNSESKFKASGIRSWDIADLCS